MCATLGVTARRRLVRDCCPGPVPGHDNAPRYGRRRPAPPPELTGRTPDQLPEQPGEGAEAGEPDNHANLGNSEVGMGKKILGPLHPPPTEVGPRRLPEHHPKLPGEVVPREPGGSGHVVKV